jgi:hypothetical protein
MGKHAEDSVVDLEWAEEDQYSPDQAPCRPERDEQPMLDADDEMLQEV